MEKKKIEKALFFHREPIVNNHLVKGNILCLGSEFCPALLAKKEYVEKALSISPSGIAIYTSLLNDEELKKTIDVLDEILKSFEGIEIMISDFGLLSWLAKKFPFVKKAIARPLSLDFMRMPYRQLSSFMLEWNISAIETDEYPMMLNFPTKPKRTFDIYLRLGPVFSAMSRFCPFTRKLSCDCSFQCRGKLDKFSVNGSSQKIYRYAKGYFSACEKIALKYKPERIVEDLF